MPGLRTRRTEDRQTRGRIGHTAAVTDVRRPAPALPGGRRTALAVLLLVVSVAAAGCDATTRPTATRTPDPTGSSGPTRSAAAPTPTADPAAAAVDAFVALVTKKGFSYQATFSGHDRHSTDILPVSKGLLQVSGSNVLVRATFTFPSGHHYPVEHRSVGGKAWIRYDSDDSWHRLTWHAADSMAAFAAIRTSADVTSLGPVKSGGTTYYRVSFRSAIVNPVMIPAVNLTETSLTTPTLTLLIDAAGRPVKGTAEVDGKGRVSGQLQEIVIDLTVTFTKVGQAVTIKAP